jgi:hypothetical protein
MLSTALLNLAACPQLQATVMLDSLSTRHPT